MSNNVVFSSVTENTNFTYNSNTYRKVATVKISCCKSVNAVNVSSGEKIYVPENAEVEVQ